MSIPQYTIYIKCFIACNLLKLLLGGKFTGNVTSRMREVRLRPTPSWRSSSLPVDEVMNCCNLLLNVLYYGT